MDGFKTAVFFFGGEGGEGAAPPFANKMICTSFLSCKHGDDMMFFSGSMDGRRGSKGNSGDSYVDRDPDADDPCD